MRPFRLSLIVLMLASLARADDKPAQVPQDFSFKPDATVTAKSVNLAGDFNNWSTTTTPMEKSADGTYKVTVKLAPGKYHYKFVLDGTTWINDPKADKSLEEDDGQKGKNSVVIVAAVEQPANNDVEHTFSYRPADGSNPKTVNLVGEFNKWSTDSNPMTRGDDGTFTIKMKLPPGTYQYKFIVDGSNWVNDPLTDKSTDKPDGNGGANSVVVIK